MSKTRRNTTKNGPSRQRHLSVRAVPKSPPDLRKLSRALIQLAIAQAEADAQAAREQDRGHAEDAEDSASAMNSDRASDD